jgi:CRISPR/Cas system-associated exonuclease Cas4 (RecB family)
LAGKPDALVKEEEFFLPVERKPLAKKLRDRYVAQLLVYMRLVEEFEGAKPPHGYLLLGPKCRRVKVQNSPQKQQWVDSMIREMRLILDGSEATAQPHPSKCAKCDVRHRCPSRLDSSSR